MTKLLSRCLWIFLLVLPVAATAGTVRGVVRNGTTGTYVPGVDIILMQLQGGMDTVANTTADAQGQYRLEHEGIGRQPMLLRVSYRGVNFHQSLPPGRDTADIEVFEPTGDARALQVTSRLIVFQPNGPTLLIGEEFSIQNRSSPPMAHYKADGNFAFQLPERAELAQVSAWGPSGMPVTQSTIDRGDRRFAIAFAFRPGESGVRLSYQVPYANDQAVVRIVSPYAAERVLLLAPPTVQVLSAGFAGAGSEQGWNVYARDGVAAGTAFEVSVSGTAPPPAAAEEPQGRDPGAGASVQVLPGRLDSLKWVLIGGFAALFVLGLIFLWRRSVGANAVPLGSPAQASANPAQIGKGRSAAAVAEVEREVSRSLDALKDTLFRLELRRQAGTISEEEYARERARAEEVLRELVRG